MQWLVNDARRVGVTNSGQIGADIANAAAAKIDEANSLLSIGNRPAPALSMASELLKGGAFFFDQQQQFADIGGYMSNGIGCRRRRCTDPRPPHSCYAVDHRIERAYEWRFVVAE